MRGILGSLIAYRARTARRSLFYGGWAKVAVAAIFMAIMVAVFLGLHWFFRAGFERIMAEPHVGPVIVRYLVEMAFASALLLGVISFFVAALFTLFRAREMDLLSSLPIGPLDLFLYRFLNAATFSSWPVLFVAAPALTALGVTSGSGYGYAAAAVSAAALLILIITVIGSVLSLIMAETLRRFRPMVVSAVLLALSLPFVALLLRRFVNREVFGLFEVTTAEGQVAAAANLQTLFAALPSHSLAELVLMVVGGEPERHTVGMALLIGSVMLVAFLLLIVAVRRRYTGLVQSYRESSFLARPEDAPSRHAPRRPFPRFFRWGHGYLFEKDLWTFLRSPEEVMRGAYLIALLALYVLTLRLLTFIDFFGSREALAGVIAAMCTVIGYFALTISMRFVFPSLSQEGRGAWVLWSSPVHAHEYFSWKLFFWSVVLGVTMEAVMAASAMIFAFPPAVLLLMAVAVFLSVATIVCITLGQGAIFPDFQNDNPESLATSPAGLFAVFLGIVYLWIMGRYAYRYTLVFLSSGQPDFVALFGMLVVSVVFVATYWSVARRAMERLEVT